MASPSKTTPKKPASPAPVLSREPTMRDVARRAGVGAATVSRVLNQSPLVTPQKAELVKRVMAEMGYKPAPVERRQGKRKNLTPGITHRSVCMLLLGQRSLRWITNCAPIYAYALEAVEAALSQRGLHCLIRHIPTFADLEALKPMPVDGFLVLGASHWSDWPARLRQFPSVSLLGAAGSGWGDCVTYNHNTIGKLAAEYLLSRGIRNTAIVGSADENIFSGRIAAFQNRMTQAGGHAECFARDDSIHISPEINTPNEAVIRKVIDQVLRHPSRPEGIFITSDVLVPAVYRELERRGAKPESKIILVGCNNEKSYLSQLPRHPAVVDIRSGLIGTEAVERLLWRLRNPKAPSMSLLVEPILIPSHTGEPA